jgi:hypothetical protein
MVIVSPAHSNVMDTKSFAAPSTPGPDSVTGYRVIFQRGLFVLAFKFLIRSLLIDETSGKIKSCLLTILSATSVTSASTYSSPMTNMAKSR